ncbi:FAD/NAD-P-binding domain-containing protein [Ganoderma leucocontextum]|nr:FAD/NAD-P-binding domain-containing protein [Ganoderma leucocontextum]
MSQTMPLVPRLHVAIIGAGLGGLLLALSLQKSCEDLRVDIYESTAELTEVGAGVGMWPRMWEIIEYLGLGDELREVSGGNNPTAQPVHIRKADEAEPIEFFELPPTLYTFHRSVLQQLLAKHLEPSTPIHFSKRLVSYAEPPELPIVLQFRDGTSATCDMLIGSDGIRSAVRRSMFNALADEACVRGNTEESSRLRLMVDPVWSGQIAYRGLIPMTALKASGFKDAGSPMILLGKDKHIVQYPINRGEVLNIAAFVNHPGREDTVYPGPWVSTTTGDKVKEHFADWSPDIPRILEILDKPLCWAVHTVRELPTYVRGRAALIGDAAHAMTPHLGAGASQAVEDGFILAAIIAQPTVTIRNLAAAFHIYDSLRRPFAEHVLHRSRRNGLLYQFNTLGWEDMTSEQSRAGGFASERLAEIGTELQQQFNWSLTSSIMEVRDRAIDMARGLERDS